VGNGILSIEECLSNVIFDLSEIRNAWQTGTPLGNDYFRQKVESKLGCKV
jgi:hypothetical protein